MKIDENKVYLIDGYDLRRIKEVAEALFEGTDRERDYGNKLHLFLNMAEPFPSGYAFDDIPLYGEE